MFGPIPTPPDILSVWRAQLLAALAELGWKVDVGPKRPADTVNLHGEFVRVMCLGGPWDAHALWHPRLAAESWAPTVARARLIDGIVQRTTRRLEGLRIAPTPETPGMFISSLELDLAGSDQSIDGAPFVLTTTSPACLQVTTMERITNE